MAQQVVNENGTGYRPPPKRRKDDMIKYDLVSIGFPPWDMKVTQPIKNILKHDDVSRKIVIPFNTNAGNGSGARFGPATRFRKIESEGYSTNGGMERDGFIRNARF